MQKCSVFVALSIALAILPLFVVGCGNPTAQTKQTDKVEAQVNAQSFSACQPLSCGLMEWKAKRIPEDADHCAVECCGSEGGCIQHFIPWVNKNTGKTDKWYDEQRRKLVDAPGGE